MWHQSASQQVRSANRISALPTGAFYSPTLLSLNRMWSEHVCLTDTILPQHVNLSPGFKSTLYTETPQHLTWTRDSCFHWGHCYHDIDSCIYLSVCLPVCLSYLYLLWGFVGGLQTSGGGAKGHKSLHIQQHVMNISAFVVINQHIETVISNTDLREKRERERGGGGCWRGLDPCVPALQLMNSDLQARWAYSTR